MFHIRDMGNGKIAIPNQKKRKPSQRYVMFLMESPLNDGFPYEKFGNFFNWTMTFRRDSDFTRPYGWVIRKNAPYDALPEFMLPPTNTEHPSWDYPRGNGN